MTANENRIIYKVGYQDGFEDGLEASKQCRGCEYIQKCQDDPQKTDYCPNVKVRNYRTLNEYSNLPIESGSINKANCLNCYHEHCPIIKLVAELSDNPMVSTEFYCQQYLPRNG